MCLKFLISLQLLATYVVKYNLTLVAITPKGNYKVIELVTRKNLKRYIYVVQIKRKKVAQPLEIYCRNAQAHLHATFLICMGHLKIHSREHLPHKACGSYPSTLYMCWLGENYSLDLVCYVSCEPSSYLPFIPPLCVSRDRPMSDVGGPGPGDNFASVNQSLRTHAMPPLKGPLSSKWSLLSRVLELELFKRVVLIPCFQ